ncbi:MAG: translation initiation factor IF-2 N-terminal domain-containing protein [Proteobacteria bacterium]|nr:translation initiation factor IF-2 N-terminal domain-containing protein [Pseudomonadota bacterium]
MALISVEQFANELHVPPSVLLEQLRAAGAEKRSADEPLSERDKSRLLEYLRKSHDLRKSHESSALKTITARMRKQTRKNKKSDTAGKSSTTDARHVDFQTLKLTLGDYLPIVVLALQSPWCPADETRLAVAIHALRFDRYAGNKDLIAIALPKMCTSLYRKALRRILKELKREERQRDEHRKLAKMVKKHPKGRMIGSTQTVNYNSAPGNITWGSRARRRP